MKTYEVTLRVTNTTQDTLTLVLEPWGEVYDFAPGAGIVVEFSADRAGEPEVVVGVATIEVYGWTGCTASVSRNGDIPEQVDTTIASGWKPAVTAAAPNKAGKKQPATSTRRRAS